MKTIITSIAFLATYLLGGCGLAKGQTQFKNGSFETWVSKSANGNPFQEPMDWFSLNSLVAFDYDETTLPVTDAHSGEKAVLLQTMEGPFNTIPGLLTLQNIVGMGGPEMDKNKLPFNGRPSHLQFWYKCFPMANDGGAVVLFLTAWNPQTQTTDTVAEASIIIDSTVSTFTFMKLPLTYFSQLNPDTFSFLASSSKDGFNPIPGSKFYIDDLALVYESTGFDENKSFNTQVYPNPFSDRLFLTTQMKDYEVEIKDATGKLVFSLSEALENELLLADLPQGIYFLRMFNQENQYQQIIVKH